MKTYRIAGNKIKASAPNRSIKDPVLITLNSDDWLLTQTTAVSSVNIFDGYKITPLTADYVNNNGNCWDTELLRKVYKTFIGAHNYKNHVQKPEKSRGIVLDAVPRKIALSNNEWSMYIDILVATNKRKYPDWCKAIEDGTIRYGSVGCSCSTLQCTQCGHIAATPAQWCNHMKFNKGQYFLDSVTGDRLRQANMVTAYPDSKGRSVCQFTEWSYLDNNPAYVGAALAYVVQIPKNTNVTFPCDRRILSREAFKIWQPYFRSVK